MRLVKGFIRRVCAVIFALLRADETHGVGRNQGAPAAAVENFPNIRARIASLEQRAHFAEQQCDTARARVCRTEKADLEALLIRIEQRRGEARSERERYRTWLEDRQRQIEAWCEVSANEMPVRGSIEQAKGNAAAVLLVLLIVLMLTALLAPRGNDCHPAGVFGIMAEPRNS